MDYRSSQSDHLVPRLTCNQFSPIWENTSPLESALAMHVFLAMPGLLCCTQASPGCSGQGMLFSGCVWAFRCCGFSCYRAWALEHRLHTCGTWAQLPYSMWALPGPGIEPVSSSLRGGFLATEATRGVRRVFMLNKPHG